MRCYRLIQTTTLTAICFSPVAGQFGIAGKRRKTDFESLQEEAAKEATVGADGSLGGGGLDDLLAGLGGGAGGADAMADLQKYMQEAMNNPELASQFENMGTQMADVFEKIQQMSPEELEKQMKDAMELLSNSDTMIDSILEKRDEVIEQLEKTKAVPAAEIARFKTDPKYFELKMRESFEQMGELFSNPEYMDMAKQALTGMAQMKDMLSGGGGADSADFVNQLKESLSDDDKLEEARLEVLKGDNEMLSQLFAADEMQEILNDPVKWRETVKEGWAGILAGGDNDEEEEE